MVKEKWAFLIGIDKYDYLNTFDYCERHVSKLKEFLIKSGFKEDNIKILPSEEDEPVIRSEIFREFPQFLHDISYGDTLFIYFIGVHSLV